MHLVQAINRPIMTLLSRFVGRSCEDEFLTGVCVSSLFAKHTQKRGLRKIDDSERHRTTNTQHALLNILSFIFFQFCKKIYV